MTQMLKLDDKIFKLSLTMLNVKEDIVPIIKMYDPSIEKQEL